MRLDAVTHTLRKCHGCIENGSRKEQHEFLAAIPSDFVNLARLLVQNLRKLLEHIVAGLVTVGVVHALEAVDVAHHDREWLVQPQ